MSNQIWPKAITLIAGFFNVLAGLALIFMPRWFFDHVAPFDPYNRHFLGDIGTFNLPIGVGLVLAGLQPSRFFSLLVLGMWANILHTLNHLYDDLVFEQSISHFLRDGLPIGLQALALIWAYWRLREELR